MHVFRSSTGEKHWFVESRVQHQICFLVLHVFRRYRPKIGLSHHRHATHAICSFSSIACFQKLYRKKNIAFVTSCVQHQMCFLELHVFWSPKWEKKHCFVTCLQTTRVACLIGTNLCFSMCFLVLHVFKRCKWEKNINLLHYMCAGGMCCMS